MRRDVDAPLPAKPSRIRRWTQFSVRSLLVAMVPLGIGLALWLREIEPYRRQARAAAALRRLEPRDAAEAQVRNQLFDRPAVVIKSEPAGPKWARNWFGDAGLMRVTTVSVSFSRFDDSTAAQIAHLPSLQELEAVDTAVGDAGVRHFAGLQDLRRLDLSYTQVTDESLRHLAGLKKLEHLSLVGNQITDAGLEHLRALPQLRQLVLIDCKIKGSGLAGLATLPNLEYLNLQGTQIEDDGLRYVGALKQVRSLSLGWLPITDQGMAHLTGMESLQFLGLHRTKITNASLQSLRKLPALEMLTIKDTQVTQRAIAAELPELAPRRIRRGLAEPLNWELPDAATTIGALLEDLGEQGDFTIQADQRSLRDTDVDLSESLAIQLHARTPEAVLHEVLDPRGLTWIIRHDMLLITTPAGKHRRPSALLHSPDLSEELAESLTQRVSLNLVGQSLSIALRELERDHDCRIRIDGAPLEVLAMPVVTVYRLREVTLRSLLEFLLDQHELRGVIEGDTIWIRPLPKGDQE